MAKVLVTGGAGYVGSHCAKALSAAGHEPVVFDNLLFGHREFVRWGELVEGDIRDAGALQKIFRDHRFDAVMHFAALAYVGESVNEPDKYYDVNVTGTRRLLSAMVHADVACIVFSSSCAIYGQPESMPIAERTMPRPTNPYGFTKFACERMMDDYGAAYGLHSARLRYFNAASADPSAEIGEDHTPETHLIPLVLDAAVGRRPNVQVFGKDYPTPDGTAIRDYVHVTDLASAHVAALEQVLGGKTFAVNLGTGRGASVSEIIDLVRQVTGKEVMVQHVPRRSGDPAQLVADPQMAAELLNWAPSRSDIETIIEDAWRWHQKRFGVL